MRWSDYRAAARNRDLTLLLVGRSVSWYGNALAPMAIVFAVLDLGLSVSAVSIAVLARSVPHLLFVLIGGTLADRRGPRRLLVAGACIAGVSQGTLAALIINRDVTLVLIAALSMINGVAAALGGPAGAALFRALVPEDDWHAASVLDRSGQQLGLMLGLSTGGVLIGWAGPGLALAVDAATFVIAATCYLIMNAPPVSQEPRPPLVKHLVQGFDFVRARSWLIAINAQTLVSSLAFACCLQVLAALVADSSFGRAGLGLAGSLQTGGAVIGIVIAGAVPAATRLHPPVLLGGVLMLPILALALGPRLLEPAALLIIFCATMLITGVALTVAGVWKNLFVLRHTPQDMMGRAGSYGLLASVGGLPLGEALATPLHAIAGTAGALLVVAVLVGVVTLTAFSLPSVRALDYADSPG